MQLCADGNPSYTSTNLNKRVSTCRMNVCGQDERGNDQEEGDERDMNAFPISHPRYFPPLLLLFQLSLLKRPIFSPEDVDERKQREEEKVGTRSQHWKIPSLPVGKFKSLTENPLSLSPSP